MASSGTSETDSMIINPTIRKPKGLVTRRLFVVALIALLLFLVGLTVFYQRVDARAKVDAARRADVIIVLGSAVWPGERPSPSLFARTQHAIALYRTG
jgi:hypothetical protein